MFFFFYFFFFFFEKIVKKFNQKYAGIKLKLVKKLEVLEMRILLNEESLQGVYKNAASRIIGMQSAGAKKFNAASVTNGEKFSKEIESAKDALHFTYFFPEIGAYTLFLTKDPHEKMIELHWDKKESHYELSPDFRICAYYALSGEVDRSIKIYGELAVFGFINLLSETESRHWFEKFNPRMLE